jgi:hypothetical protein
MLTGGTPMGIEVKSVTQFQSEWRAYSRHVGFKALAVAGDLEGVYVSGYAYAYPSEDMAIEAAFEYCEGRRTDRRITEKCRLYAVGDDVVDKGSAGSDS